MQKCSAGTVTQPYRRLFTELQLNSRPLHFFMGGKKQQSYEDTSFLLFLPYSCFNYKDPHCKSLELYHTFTLCFLKGGEKKRSIVNFIRPSEIWLTLMSFHVGNQEAQCQLTAQWRQLSLSRFFLCFSSLCRITSSFKIFIHIHLILLVLFIARFINIFWK